MQLPLGNHHTLRKLFALASLNRDNSTVRRVLPCISLCYRAHFSPEVRLNVAFAGIF